MNRPRKPHKLARAKRRAWKATQARLARMEREGHQRLRSWPRTLARMKHAAKHARTPEERAAAKRWLERMDLDQREDFEEDGE